MKLHYSKILLFFLPLNILLTSSYVNAQKNPYITPHHTQTNRSLCECDIKSSSYDNDEEIKSVKEIFDRQTSQRFQEYEERMKEKRQKRKEERDKNIQDIILKDKMEKSLADKIEKGCLRCGCALGGGVLPVWGLVSGLWYATWSQYVTQKAIQKGIEAGIATVVSELKDVAESFKSIHIDIIGMVNAKTYRFPQVLTESIYTATENVCGENMAQTQSVCASLGSSNNPSSYAQKVLHATVKGIAAAKDAEGTEAATYTSTTSSLTTAIAASVVAIVVIVLVMIIIYLVLRYRRKKKINKKAQYTKLLNQ
ncbi:PIR protein [Plasmodium reichenowi]|uniref:PIR protein n=1 Tax=Plasmodium reichenowi TaxID=5854 RepID=A0A2P9D228_PLARE|nr:PIR protein [Plasmodium reichenowi]